MNLIRSHKFALVWLIFIIPLISYLLFRKTFNLALYGDDWLQLYNIYLSFDIHKSLSFFDIKSYLGAYWPQYFFLGIIRHFFDYTPQAYFAASLGLRILATISIFFFARNLGQSTLAGFLASLLFTFTTAGLQTTDWVFNMNTYAGIFFLNIALIFYLKLQRLKTFISWSYIFFAIFFILAIGVVPVRMHGALPFLLAIEFYLHLIFEKKSIFRIDRFLFSRVALASIILLILIKAGSFGSGGDITTVLKTASNHFSNAFQNGKYEIPLYFLGTLGNIAIPNSTNLSIFSQSLLATLIFFSSFGLLITFALLGDKREYLALFLINILWGIVGITLVSLRSMPFIYFFSITIGFQTLALSLIAYFSIKRRYPSLALSIIVSLFWMVFFTLLYWLRDPYLIFDSISRYMTMGAVGFSILFAALFTSICKSFFEDKNGLAQVKLIRSVALAFLILLLFTWLNINLKSTSLYLSELEANRNINLANRTWNDLKNYVPKLDENNPSVFFFTYDNPTSLYMVLTFGFWPHAGLEYKIDNWQNTPIPTDSYQELLELVKDGEAIKKLHARKAEPVPISRVFAFDFRNGKLTNIKDQVRQQLLKDLSQAQ